jgi:hypothetical protein
MGLCGSFMMAMSTVSIRDWREEVGGFDHDKTIEYFEDRAEVIDDSSEFESFCFGRLLTFPPISHFITIESPCATIWQ